MKQFSFLTEIVLSDGNPTIIIRDPRGAVVKITTKPEEVSSFCEEVISKLEASNSSNSNSNEN